MRETLCGCWHLKASQWKNCIIKKLRESATQPVILSMDSARPNCRPPQRRERQNSGKIEDKNNGFPHFLHRFTFTSTSLLPVPMWNWWSLKTRLCFPLEIADFLSLIRRSFQISTIWKYFPNDTELALGMTLLELHYILQVFCVRQEDGGGVNRGS